jgi:RNA recognition motif-containing protein
MLFRLALFFCGGDMANRLFVGNLPYDITETELREYFSTIGPVSYISIPTDRETGRQRGFAFLEFKERAQADEAIRRFDKQSFKGRPLAVNEARAREDRQQASDRPQVSARPQASPRPPISRSSSTAVPNTANQTDNEPNRNYGPDAQPRRSRSKKKEGIRADRVSKGPMREVVRGQVFLDDEDDDDYDNYDDYDDYDDTESSEENTADHERDADEDNT